MAPLPKKAGASPKGAHMNIVRGNEQKRKLECKANMLHLEDGSVHWLHVITLTVYVGAMGFLCYFCTFSWLVSYALVGLIGMIPTC